ncbi:MAG: tRNA (guanosine(46)-N7)-methyltransferase TrmB [Hyphomicrobiaceae bacterium]|nr:MAG: tRNA (guanosine(46)-N7)-methyltransferase TrmB [Hyphomicrobiaceae bacterium]
MGGVQRPGGPLRSFGRRKGKPLSPRQERLVKDVLPRVALDLGEPAPAPLTGLLTTETSEVWLEIGFGGAEHLVWQAKRNPCVGFIGVEPYLNGIVKALDAIETADLRNVRVHDGDARDVLAWLPPASVARAFVLFPDPWPKMRHRKRRLLNPEALRAIARVLRPGGELRLASDIADYVAQMLEVALRSEAFSWLAERPADWRSRPDDWPATRYEAKARAEGRSCAYLRFERR